MAEKKSQNFIGLAAIGILLTCGFLCPSCDDDDQPQQQVTEVQQKTRRAASKRSKRFRNLMNDSTAAIKEGRKPGLLFKLPKKQKITFNFYCEKDKTSKSYVNHIEFMYDLTEKDMTLRPKDAKINSFNNYQLEKFHESFQDSDSIYVYRFTGYLDQENAVVYPKLKELQHVIIDLLYTPEGKYLLKVEDFIFFNAMEDLPGVNIGTNIYSDLKQSDLKKTNSKRKTMPKKKKNKPRKWKWKTTDSYIVQPGDTYYRISRVKGISESQLKALNGPNLRIGQEIILKRKKIYYE